MAAHLPPSNPAPIRLSELTRWLQQTIEGVFGQQSFWIIADVTNYTYKPQSNYHYFELVEKDKSSSKILAKIAGRAWGNASINISNFEKATGQKFRNDINVLIQVSVQYNPSFGLQLNLIDIDTNFTLGQFEQQRKATLERLVRENPDFIQKQGEEYLTRNGSLKLNNVIQRIAVLSSETSAGYLDFKHTLDHNAFNYRFEIDNYFTLVQGEVNARQVLTKLIEVFQSGKPYDVLVIIRGGGAQMDFLIFDNYDLSRAIARFPIPVITGIGHQKNETIADLMAHTATKTPTKVAEFIIAHNRNFEESILNLQKMMLIKTYQLINLQKDRLVQLNNNIIHTSRNSIHRNQHGLMNLSATILTNPKIIISNRKKDLSNLSSNLQSYSKMYFVNKEAYLGHFISIMKLMSPQNILNKGFAIIKVNNKIVSNADGIEKGTELTVQFADTQINTTVNDKTKHNGSEFNL
ncbi:exodeoxyribonuclease VII large subunit [Pedobacter sp. GR22-6]|uniref:exodeoxyribonuclease VII large subunit n=1 Tax=Pedobacter sp. GR22-6 TaxID=3127957 RepID=UPI00307E9608